MHNQANFAQHNSNPPRKWRRVWIVGILIFIVVHLPAFGSASVSKESAYQIAEAYRMEGVPEIVSGMVSAEIEMTLKKEMGGWVVESFTDRPTTHDPGPKTLLDKNELEKNEIKERLKAKIKKYLPEIVRKVLYEKLFMGEFGDEVKEVREIVDKITSELKVTINDRVDEMAGKLYDQVIDKIEDHLKQKHGPLDIDLTDIRGTVDGILQLENFEWGIMESLSEAVGESTAKALRGRVEDILAGELPPEFKEYLEKGPEEFARYAEKIKENLPGKKFDELKDQILHTPLFIIPNGVYGGILAISASRHIAAAYKGAVVDLYELKRAAEVSRVLVWQLKNKEGLSVDLGSLIDIAKVLGDKFGISLDKLGRLGETLKDAKKKLGDLEQKLDRLDKLIKDNLDDIKDQLEMAVAELQGALEDFQNTLFSPLVDVVNKADSLVDNINREVLDIIPDDFKGIPKDWKDFRAQFGIKDGVFGKFGKKSPWDIIQDWAKETGLYDAYQKFKRDMKRTADDVNDTVSGALATAATEVVDKFGFTDRLAAALGIPAIPAQNPSIENPLDPVLLHNGEFYYSSIDLAIPGRGLDYQFVRIYRSRANFKNVMGYNWTHNYDEHLVIFGDEVIHIDKGGEKHIFKRDRISGYQQTPKRQNAGTPQRRYTSPPGIFSTLTVSNQKTASYILEDPDGLRTFFSKSGLMIAKTDRFGNMLKFEHDKYGRLTKVIDTLEREINYTYNPKGLLENVADFSGRELTFVYDKFGDLVSSTGPKSLDFPKGKTKRYSYISGDPNEDLNHNMVRVMDPRGNIYLKIGYGHSGLNLDRVIWQQYGSGGKKMQISYKPVLPAYLFELLESDLLIGVDEVLVTDRRGVVHTYRHNARGNVLEEFMIGSGGNKMVVSKNSYNKEGLKVFSAGRSGIGLKTTYDTKNPERRSQGNVLEKVRIGRNGSDAGFWRFKYEPSYNRVTEAVLADGVKYTLSYDDRRVSIEIVGGASEKINEEYLYNEYGQITLKIDPERNEFAYLYDGSGLAMDPTGLRYSYDKVGNVIAVEDASGNRTHYTLNSLNQMITMVSPEPFSYKTSYIYDASDNISEIITTDGMKKTYSYDDLDYLTSISAEVEKGKFLTTAYSHDPEGRVTKITRPEGNPVNYEYNEEGSLVRIIRGDADVGDTAEIYEFSYDRFGELSGIKDGGGHKTQIVRDSLGRVLEVINPVKTREIRAYDSRDLLTDIKWIDKSGELLAESGFVYDGLRRLTEKKWLLSERWIAEKYKYNKRGEVIQIIDRGGSAWGYSYDRLGNLISMIGPMGNRVEYEYDANSKLIKSVVFGDDDSEILTKFEHDSIGRMISMVDTYGGASRFEYDGIGNIIKKTGPRDSATEYIYDSLGRRVEARSQIDASKFAITKFVWDGNNRLRAITDALGNTTRYDYNHLDRLTQSIFADGTDKKYTYDSAGNLVEIKKQDGTIVGQLIDPLGNIIERNIKTFHQTFSYDGLGRLIASSDNNDPDDPSDDVAEYYKYDQLSRMTAEAEGGRWVVTSFDDMGMPQVIKYPSGELIYNMYDLLGRLKESFLNGERIAGFGYKGINKIAASSYSNGTETEYSTDLLANITGQTVQNPHELLETASYDYLPDGLLKSKRVGDENSSYSYDGMGRLTGVAGSSDYRWVLDDVGNWLEYISPQNSATQAPRHPGTPTPRNIFDKNGNLIKDDKFKYKYDGLNRLTDVFDGGGKRVAKYIYDALGRRVGKTSDFRHRTSDRESYIYSGWNVIEEFNGDKLLKSYIHGKGLDNPIYVEDGDDDYYYHKDYLGSVIALSDEKGKITERYSYQPYGQLDSENSGVQALKHSNTLLFTSGRLDQETGLYYLRNRYYSPESGRFITQDPLGFKNAFYTTTHALPNGSRFKSRDYVGMDVRRPHTPQALFASAWPDLNLPEMNLYQYANSNPVNFTDPLGLRVFIDRDGNNINISITIETYGPEASEKLNDYIATSIREEWSGSFGKYKVKTVANVTLRGETADYDRHRFETGYMGISEVDCPGCSSGRLYTFDGRGGGVDSVEVIAHETGHFLGLTDQYTIDKNGISHESPGWKNNLMACVEERCHLEEKNIEDMLEAYNGGRMNIGLHRYRPALLGNRRRHEENLSQSPGVIDYK